MGQLYYVVRRISVFRRVSNAEVVVRQRIIRQVVQKEEPARVVSALVV